MVQEAESKESRRRKASRKGAWWARGWERGQQDQTQLRKTFVLRAVAVSWATGKKTRFIKASLPAQGRTAINLYGPFFFLTPLFLALKSQSSVTLTLTWASELFPAVRHFSCVSPLRPNTGLLPMLQNNQVPPNRVLEAGVVHSPLAPSSVPVSRLFFCL